jgi:putative tryptophan/tyrosine transport system permease protein
MLIRTLTDTLVTGLPYVLPVLATYLVFRILDQIDLTIEGSFVLGAAVSAVLLVRGVPAPAATVAGGAAGAAAGALTAAVHGLLRMPVLMAGIVSMIGLYTVNLRVMGRPSIGLTQSGTIYAAFDGWQGPGRDLAVVAILAIVVLAVVAGGAAFLRTEAGLALRSHGDGPRMARSHGVDGRVVTVVALATANGASALGGALVAQGQGFSDVNMGLGVVVGGIAAVLVGELVVRPARGRILGPLVAAVVGALLYRLVLVTALRAGLPPTDLKLVTALVLLAVLALQRLRPDLAGGTRR